MGFLTQITTRKNTKNMKSTNNMVVAAEPAIAGVTLELYVSISRAIADVGYDACKAPEIAAEHGISATSWDSAVAGWNLRMQTQPAIAEIFNTLYTRR